MRGGPVTDELILEEFIMTRRKWLWALLALPVAVASGLAYASTQKPNGYTCPITGETLACEKCCPLNAPDKQAQKVKGFTCPITGEQLPCEKCCPLNGAKTETKQEAAQPYICPITGKELDCPNCCPLNNNK